MTQEARAQCDKLLFAQSIAGGGSAAATLDTRGARHATIRLCLSQRANTNAVGPTISLLESDSTAVTSFATVVANRVNESLASQKEIRWDIDLRKRRRYLRLAVTAGTHTANDVISAAVAVATLSRLETDPDTDAESGADALVTL